MEQDAERLKGEAEMCKADLTEKTQLVAVEKCSLEEQLATVNKELKLREKQLEIMATEKANIDNELSRMKADSELAAVEVREGPQQLETTIVDTARLTDEVLAKTQQVKQHKKQTDCYKARLEETSARLEQSQRKLQHFQDQNKKIEEDHQNQVCSVHIHSTDIIPFVDQVHMPVFGINL